MKYILTVTANPALDMVMHTHRFKIGAGQHYDEYLLSAGGKGINVCRALKCLKVHSLATGFAGGFFGRYILQKLKAERIAFDFVEIPRETRINITMIDPGSRQMTRLLGKGPQIPSSSADLFLKKFKILVKNSFLIVLAGSHIPGVGADFYNKLITIARTYQKKVILDTSGKALSQGIKAKPFMVKANRDEIETVLKMRLSSGPQKKKALRRLLNLGIMHVCITLGKQGAIASDGRNFLSVRSPEQHSPYTVGSGDAFTAGFVCSYLKRHSFKECVTNAVASATASVLNPLPGYLVKRQLVPIARRLQINML